MVGQLVHVWKNGERRLSAQLNNTRLLCAEGNTSITAVPNSNAEVVICRMPAETACLCRLNEVTMDMYMHKS